MRKLRFLINNCLRKQNIFHTMFVRKYDIFERKATDKLIDIKPIYLVPSLISDI